MFPGTWLGLSSCKLKAKTERLQIPILQLEFLLQTFMPHWSFQWCSGHLRTNRLVPDKLIDSWSIGWKLKE